MFAAALILVLALAGVFVYLRVSSDLTSAIDDGLRSRIGDLAALVAGAGDEPPQLSGGLFESQDGFSQVLTRDGEVVASTLALRAGSALEPELIRRAAGAPILLEGREVPGVDEETRILARPARTPHGVFEVVAGTSTEDRREALAGIISAFLIAAPFSLALASGLGYLLAARSLAPVEAMRRRADGITLERSGERLPLPRAEDELRRLGETLNSMLERLEASLERQRVFVADASHELRTPLAVLQAELELADRPLRTPEELRAALRSASEEVDRLSRLAEDLLVIARVDQGRLPVEREQVDLCVLLERARRRVARLARERGREISLDVPAGLQAELDVVRMEQAIGNLVDNALRHGSGNVRLSARPDDRFVVLEVSDDGPGFPDGFESEAFERFTRADDGRTGGGAGLGLAIVQAIVRAHGGRVTVAGSDVPATTLRIAVPRDAPPGG